MRVFVRKPRSDEHLAVTFGGMEAELSEDVIKAYSLGPALKRIGRALARKYFRRQTRDEKDEVIGVKLRCLGFDLLLARKSKPDKT
jgi:hypothetical protein